MADRVAQGADAQLDGAAVPHQAAGVQADGMVLQSDRQFGHGEQVAGALTFSGLDQNVELVLRPVSIAGHEGQLGFDHPHRGHWPAGAGYGHHFQGHVGVATQADAAFASVVAHGHQLGEDIRAMVDHVAGHMGVVAADVVLLWHGLADLRAGLEEELPHRDVGRQLTALLGAGVLQILIGRHRARHHGVDECTTHTRCPRRIERECGENDQIEPGVARHPVVQRIDEAIGLAQAQWDAEHDLRADAVDDGVDGGGVVGCIQRHGRRLGWLRSAS